MNSGASGSDDTRQPPPEGKPERVGFAGLFSGGNALPAILLGFMSVLGLVLVYATNTWLPELMLRAGFNAKGSLSFLLVSNGGAVIKALLGSRIADRFGPQLVVVASAAPCSGVSWLRRAGR